MTVAATAVAAIRFEMLESIANVIRNATHLLNVVRMRILCELNAINSVNININEHDGAPINTLHFKQFAWFVLILCY